MIRRIIFEPKLKKLYLLVAGLLVLFISGFLFFQFKQFTYIHSEQIKSYQRVVGKLSDKYPEEENEIVRCVLLENNKIDEYSGAKILEKYGYNLDTTVESDPVFSRYEKFYIINNTLFIMVILLLITVIIAFFIRYTYLNLTRISDVLDAFLKGNFSYKEDTTSEGVMSIIYSQLYQLAKSVSFNYEKLNNEKESSKALVTDISHQLKTPLASLNMCNSILEDEELTSAERREFLEMSNKNLKKLYSLIESLINLSRLEVAMIKLKPAENNLIDTIISAYNSAYMKAIDKNIDMIFDVDKVKQPILIKHDKKWTEEAIFNVLDNSIKYTNVGGKIILDIEESLNYIKINISDTGIGINQKQFNNIFKRFYRCKGNDIEGSGVGLYLTRKILEDQGGNIIVKSKEGKGSTFTILLAKK